MVYVQSHVGFLIVLVFCPYVFAMKITKCYAKNNDEMDVENTELRLVNVIFRHGDRTLDDSLKDIYPNISDRNHDDYPNDNGLLTNVGKKEAFRFGQMLKETYSHFLGDVYYPPNVYARSTALPRTKMTLQLVLAGLYPPVDIRQRWNAELEWQPVDTIYARVFSDGLLFPTTCKEYKEAYDKLLKNATVLKEIDRFNGLMERLSKPIGKNITHIYQLFVLYHILLAQASMGLVLPDWTYDVFPYGELHDATVFQYKLYNYNDELIKLNGGVLLHKIVEDMNGTINKILKDRKINLFSSHDINVNAVLYALGINDDSVPDFMSSVIIELREKNAKYFVRVLRYLGRTSPLIAVKLPDCDLLCPLEKFLLTSTIAEQESPDCPLTISLP